MDDVPVIDNVAARLAFIRVRVDRRLPTDLFKYAADNSMPELLPEPGELAA
jgi:hypothetical protein